MCIEVYIQDHLFIYSACKLHVGVGVGVCPLVVHFCLEMLKV